MTFTRRSQRPYPSSGGTPTPASSTASRPTACVDAWIEDFRKDISRNDVPTLILDGDADSDSAARCHVPKAGEDDQGRQVHRAKDGSNGVLCTHAEQVNAQLVSFLANPTRRLMENQSWRP